MIDIVVVGSLSMDLVVSAERLPRPGETVVGGAFTTVPGGKGANQAAAAARLGAHVEMVGRVGADRFGDEVLQNLARQGVGAEGVRPDPEAPTGIAMIMLESTGENAIVIAPGANHRLTLEHVQAELPRLQGARYWVMQLESPLPLVQGAVALAHSQGAQVVLNAAPAAPLEQVLLRQVDYLVVNESEAETLTGIAVPDLAGAERAGAALLESGVGVAVITLGARGAWMMANSRGIAECRHVPARQVKVVDTTAAGDAFVGGMVAAMLRGLPLPEAVRYGTCAGTCATLTLGAQSSLPSQAQVDALYAQGWA